ncbi:hypothetical protein MTR67_014519 [Solanum verrucosum]|uniref:Uncharacterized protein n=1 Tax=Solanum verrucosum TaxID=315347 RepID=A0AAF0QCD0_SOLVR|nr:hypothetical protein MTR67_014519 [Solanum verrucosum]
MLVVVGVVNFFAGEESGGSCWSSSVGQEGRCLVAAASSQWHCGLLLYSSWSCCLVVFIGGAATARCERGEGEERRKIGGKRRGERGEEEVRHRLWRPRRSGFVGREEKRKSGIALFFGKKKNELS